jgi:DNA-binding GntR family transcriptional regulator
MILAKLQRFLMPPTFRSKNEVVHETLRQAIVRGEYKPGQRLVIDDIAANMGVSQIPIREALRQLEADGFVTIEPYVGATVTELDASSISEIFALLESLEVICGRVACEKMNDADMDTLDGMIDEMDAYLGAIDIWTERNKQLHQFICDRAETPLVKKMMQKALDHWDRLRLYYLKDVFAHRIATAQAEHVRIHEAFRTRNPETVERVIREHNRAALAAYTDYLRLKAATEVGELDRQP